MSGDSDIDLTGQWSGLFNYPDGGPATPFEAELRESAGCVTGTTTEPGDTIASAGQILHAVIDGRRDGSSVRFLKMYDGAIQDYDVVHNEGVVHADGDEIDGRWTVPGIWSGTFLMVRTRKEEQAAERKVSEEVR